MNPSTDALRAGVPASPVLRKFARALAVVALSLLVISCGGGKDAASPAEGDPLTLSAAYPASVVAGQVYDHTPTVTHAKGSLTASIVNKPGWATFDPSSGRLQGTPGTGQAGTTSGIVVSVSDGHTTVATAPFSITVVAIPTSDSTYFISPTGSDANSGKSASAPWRSFKRAFEAMVGGEELVLLDGTYSIASGTGILREVDDNGNPQPLSASIPSGLSRAFPTLIRAAVPGNAIIEGTPEVYPLSIGRSTRKDRYIRVQGLRFKGGGQLYNTQYVTIKDTSFTGSFSIGTSDHANGNTHNLIEDVWISTTNRRVAAINYRAHKNIWRRVVVRSEGCDSPGCEGAPKADPSVGITVYDSQDVSMQNVVVIDRLIRNDVPYGDFATAQHTEDPQYHLGRNEWLGCLSVNSQDAGLHFEADNVTAGGSTIWTIKHFVAVGNREGAINLGNKPYNYDSAGKPPSLVENATLILSQALDNRSVLRVNAEQTSAIARQTVAIGGTRTGFNMPGSTVEDSAGYNPGAMLGDFDAAIATQNCIHLVTNPLTDGSLRYPLRVESGSTLDQAIAGKKLGASVVNRYGVDGTTFGDSGANTLTSASLWPWPNEARIKKEMGVDVGVTRGFCANGTRRDGGPLTLTSYIWEQLGNTMPATVYP